MQLEAIIAVVLAYLAGSVDFGAILPRLGGVDIYAVGSGNPGASNVMRTMGKGWATAVLLGDIGKGTVAALIGDLWVGGATGFACLLGAVAGHCYPAWHGFKGGKGVAALLGGVMWLEPLLGMALVAAWVLIVWLTKVAAVASLLLIAALVPALAGFDHRGWSLAWAGAAAALVVYRHRGNIGRLVRGEERKVTAS